MTAKEQLELTAQANEKMLSAVSIELGKSLNQKYPDLWDYLMNIESHRRLLSGLLARADRILSHAEMEAQEKIRAEKMSALEKEITIKHLSAEAREYRDGIKSLIMSLDGKIDFGRARLVALEVRVSRIESK